jgi:hypothetical protein
METNLKIVGFANQSINGYPITNKGIHVNYDGHDVDINGYDDGKLYYMHLDNDDIKNLLNMPTSKITLEERLLTDFAPSRYRTPTPYPIAVPIKSRKTKKRKPKNKSKTPRNNFLIINKPKIYVKKSKTKKNTPKSRTPPIDRTIY